MSIFLARMKTVLLTLCFFKLNITRVFKLTRGFYKKKPFASAQPLRFTRPSNSVNHSISYLFPAKRSSKKKWPEKQSWATAKKSGTSNVYFVPLSQSKQFPFGKPSVFLWTTRKRGEKKRRCSRLVARKARNRSPETTREPMRPRSSCRDAGDAEM